MPTVTLTIETKTLLDEQMTRGGFADTDEVVRFALEHLAQARGEDYEDLDAETRESIEAGEAEHQQGLGRPWAEVRAELEAEFGTGVDRP